MPLEMIATVTQLCQYCTLCFICIALTSVSGTTFYVRKAGNNSFDNLEQVASLINVSVTPSVIVIQQPHLSLTNTIQFHRNVSGVSIEGNGVKITCKEDNGGLIFNLVDNVQIRNLTLYSCGSLHGGALVFQNCTNVTVSHILIAYSKGSGLTLIDSNGKLEILWINITKANQTHGHGAGVHVRFSGTLKETLVSTLTFLWCNFEGNQIMNGGSGGGMALRLTSTIRLTNVSLVSCTFQSNHAASGGGLFVKLNGRLSNITISIHNCNFSNNSALYAGGGFASGYSRLASEYAAHGNKTVVIIVEDVTFANNTARYGGGSSIYGDQRSQIRSKSGESIIFRRCMWYGNVAQFSAAVDISPNVYNVLSKGFLIIPQFIDCSFICNKPDKGSNARQTTAGAFVVSKFEIAFSGKIFFLDNSQTALHGISSTIQVHNKSHIIFEKNSGVNGGAIAMYGFSSFRIEADTVIEFINNSAQEKGGGLYHHTFDQHDFVSTKMCFIYFAHDAINISVKFRGNTAIHGPSIYAMTFKPCRDFWKNYSSSNFQLDEPNHTALATAGKNFTFMQPQPFRFIPGQEIQLPVSMTDEFEREAHPLYRVSVEAPNGSVGLDRNYTLTKFVKFWGKPEQHGTLSISQSGYTESAYKINISALPCPPGYVNNEKGICQCSAHTITKYQGIRKCEDSQFQAYLDKYHWVGYLKGKLCTSQCPLEFCKHQPWSWNDTLLPRNKSELDSFVCGANHMGVLCANCTTNTSVYFHSPLYKCGDISHCHLSALFYILSEIVPMVLLFTVVIFFDIRFTSGTINGFVLFCQISNILSYRRGAHRVPALVHQLSQVYKLLYGIFNLDFFNIERLSFCLWPSATMLDILSFKYVTTAIAFLLVMALVVAMRYCCYNALSKIKRQMSLKESVVHGLTTFLIISYTQCAKVSFQILIPVELAGKGKSICNYVAYHGGVQYFGYQHFPYAILAIASIASIVAIPPALLIIFPGYMHLLECCGLSENQILNCPMKLKPFLDSFQSCFKDHLRSFAGVYLLYRVIFLANYAFCINLYNFYAVTEFSIIVILTIHSIAQPYKSKLHNVLDSLLFVDLAVINGITTYFFTYPEASGKLIEVLFWIQLILLYLPLFSLSTWLMWKLVTATRLMLENHPITDSEECEHQNIELVRLSDDTDIPYEEFKQNAIDTEL